MLYVYDLPMTNRRVTSFSRYGATYKLEKRFKMGDRVFYSFICPGMEKILVVPQFIEQYEEVKKLKRLFGVGKKFDTYEKLVRKSIDKEATIDEYPNDESDTGSMMIIMAEYKDIKVTFEYMNGKLELSTEFEIINNNLFGNGVVVQTDVGVEILKEI